MSGTKKINEPKHYKSDPNKELTHVKFFIDFCGNFSLFDREKLYQSLSKKITKHLNQYGVKNTDIGPLERGGGADIETIGDIFQILWEHKDIIEFVFSIIEFFKRRWENFQYQTQVSLEPRIVINFLIESQNPAKLEADYLDFFLQQSMANLLTVSSGVVKELKVDFDGFLFDINLEAKVESINYGVHFSIPHENLNIRFNRRIFSIINCIIARKNFYTSYSFTKWWAICRKDKEFVKTKGCDYYIGVGNYYLFFSSTIIKDKFKWYRESFFSPN